METVETSETSTLCVETRQMSVLATDDICTDVCFGNRRHLSCLNSRHLSCLSSRHLSCLNSRHLICCRNRKCLLSQEQTSFLLMSQKSQLWQCHNVQVSEGQSGPKSAKMVRNGSRMVASPRESTQMNPTAISERLGPVTRTKTCTKRTETLDWPVPGRGP